MLLLLGCTVPAPTPPSPPPPPPPEARITVEVTPPDAAIFVGDHRLTDGVLVLPPGRYPLSVARRGFAAQSSTVILPPLPPQGPPTTLTVTLTPQPQALSFTVQPPRTAWSLHTSDGAVRQGIGDFSGEVPAGQTRLQLSGDRLQPRVIEAFIDADHSAAYWMDREGQLLRKVLEFRSGHHPKGLRFSPDGSEIWASFLGGPPSVDAYDAATGQRRHRLSLGKHGAVEIIYSHDGSRVYASQMETASVYEIDRGSGTLLRQLATRATWSKVMALHPDGERLYVSNWVSSDITELDLTTGEVRRELDTVDTPRGLWLDPAGEWLYVVSFGGGELARIHIETGRQEVVFSGGAVLRHVVADAERGRMYISDMRKGRIWLIDMKTWRATTLASTDANPNTIDLTPDGRLLFVSCRGANNRESYYKPGPQWGSVLVFDALTGALLDAIVAGNQPTALDVSDDGRFLAWSDMLDDRISVYEIPPLETLLSGGGGRGAVYRRELRK